MVSEKGEFKITAKQWFNMNTQNFIMEEFLNYKHNIYGGILLYLNSKALSYLYC